MTQVFSSPLGIPLYAALVAFFVAWIGHRVTPRRCRVPIRSWGRQEFWDSFKRGFEVLTAAGEARASARERFRNDQP